MGDILEHSLNEIYIFDADSLHFINVNEPARRNLGYSMEELGLMTPLDLKHDFNETLFLQNYIEPLRTRQITSKLFTTQHFRKDGSAYPVEVLLQPGNYHDRIVFIALILDISDRVAAETRYQREKALLKMLIDNIPDLIFIKDKQSVYLGCNKAFEQYCGLAEQDIIGKTDFDFVPQARADYFRQWDLEALTSGNVSEREEWITYPDGREALLDTLKSPYFGEDREILGIIGVSRDITHMRVIENARHAALLRFEAIFNYAPQVAIQGFARDGTVLHWNHANELIYGYSSEQALGQKIQDLLLTPDQHQEFMLKIESIWQCGADHKNCSDNDHCKLDNRCLVTKSSEYWCQHRDGRSVWVYRAMFPIVEDGQITEIFCMDVEISELKHVEMELRELNEELELCVEREVEISRQKDLALIHQARFAALGEMIGNIAHQWRQPLNSLSLLMAILRETCHQCGSNAEILQHTYTESQRLIRAMSQTITDFSNFFKSGREEEPLCVMDGVTHAVSMIKPVLDDAEITLVIEGMATARVQGIYNEFVQVVMNLMTNAKDAILDHCGSGGRIGILIGEDEQNVFMSIRDNGGGLPDHIIEKIFDPYFTTKPQGTGIGLSMVRMLLERANGCIGCDNVEGGAVFTVSLPKLSEEAG